MNTLEFIAYMRFTKSDSFAFFCPIKYEDTAVKLFCLINMSKQDANESEFSDRYVA